jgi:predicted RND superfamily exporter protein
MIFIIFCFSFQILYFKSSNFTNLPKKEKKKKKKEEKIEKEFRNFLKVIYLFIFRHVHHKRREIDSN